MSLATKAIFWPSGEMTGRAEIDDEPLRRDVELADAAIHGGLGRRPAGPEHPGQSHDGERRDGGGGDNGQSRPARRRRADCNGRRGCRRRAVEQSFEGDADIVRGVKALGGLLFQAAAQDALERLRNSRRCGNVRDVFAQDCGNRFGAALARTNAERPASIS